MTSGQEAITALYYRIGKLTCEIRNLAEYFWIFDYTNDPSNPAQDELPESLQVVYQGLIQDLKTIEDRQADSHPLTVAATGCRQALVKAMEAFERDWMSRSHIKMLKSIPIEPELGRIRIKNIYQMICQSALNRTEWDAFDISVISFEEKLEGIDRVAFELGAILRLVDNLPLTGRHRFVDFGDRLVSCNVMQQRYIDSRLLPKIEILWSKAIQGFPQLTRHSFSANSKRDRDVLGDVCEKAFKQKPSADITVYAPYQLLVDNVRQRVTRFGVTIELNQREWILVTAIMADQQQRLTKQVLRKNLGCHGDTAQYQVASRLRRKLAPLKLALKNEHGYGWRLMDEAN